MNNNDILYVEVLPMRVAAQTTADQRMQNLATAQQLGMIGSRDASMLLDSPLPTDDVVEAQILFKDCSAKNISREVAQAILADITTGDTAGDYLCLQRTDDVEAGIPDMELPKLVVDINSLFSIVIPQSFPGEILINWKTLQSAGSNKKQTPMQRNFEIDAAGAEKIQDDLRKQGWSFEESESDVKTYLLNVQRRSPQQPAQLLNSTTEQFVP